MKQCLIAKTTTLLQQLPIVRNLARQKFVAQFIIGLLKSRNVQFCEVAQHLNDGAKPASNETRIQDFFRQVTLDYLALARLLVSLLPGQGKLCLCLDRTEWDFGQCQVNLLLVTVGRGEWHVPLYWHLLDNRSGNSNAAQRIAVLEACLAVLGRDQIELVLGDREFVGHAWFKWLQDQGLPFVMRLPKHHHLTLASGECRAVAALGLAPGQVRRFAHVQVDGVWGKALVKALDGGQFLFLFGHEDLPDLAPLYARRWSIEQCFQNLKGRGFNLENTHLRCHLKLRKLVALVSLAYAFCLSVGQDAAEHSPPIARKKHGYRATSLSRHGLNILRQITRPATASTDALARQVMALLNWLISQVACYQIPGKMAG
ncbi:IS4 family transposase [Hymenobacter antarcticus]|uniref:IS4-like element ISLpn9 family transposase n=1 Tax=Hymenobacter antarcticus TaxID=486270 RepID=A0ABP7R7U0_9BACT